LGLSKPKRIEKG